MFKPFESPYKITLNSNGGSFQFRLKQYLHFYIQRKARSNRNFHNDGMMMKMSSETENTTQQHGRDKHQAYPEQHGGNIALFCSDFKLSSSYKNTTFSWIHYFLHLTLM